MQPFLRAFADELVKVAEDPYREALKDARREVGRESKDDQQDHVFFRRGGAPQRRDYLTSTIIGAMSAPLLAIAGKSLARKLHNRAVLRAMRENPLRAFELEKDLARGPLIGRARPDLPAHKRPTISHGDLLTDAARGALAGSVMQAISDRFSGAKNREKK